MPAHPLAHLIVLRSPAGPRWRVPLLLSWSVICAWGAAPAAAQVKNFVGVGAVYAAAADAAERHRDLTAMRAAGFNVVLFEGEPPADGLRFVDRLLAGAADARVHGLEGRTAVMPARRGAADIRLRAWRELAGGARALLFDDWRTLRLEPAALASAGEFARAVVGNMPLYAPLRLRPGAAADVQVEAEGGGVEAWLLESATAFVLVAVNGTQEFRSATFRFSPALPEAIWQNMLAGAAVHFVAAPHGSTYTRALAPGDVLVLMIQRRWR